MLISVAHQIVPYPKMDWRLPYQCGLVVLAVLIFFTNLDVYWDSAGILPLAPLHWIILFLGATIPVTFPLSSVAKSLPKPLLLWCGGYFLISLLWFWLFTSLQRSPVEAFQELRDRTLSIIFIVMMLVMYSRSSLVQVWARSAFIVAGLLGTMNNIYEFFNPLIFAGLNETGRPAGFYVNSNNCGCALLESLLIGVTLLRPLYRIPFTLAIGVGIFLTFSRAALLAWVLITTILFAANILPRHQGIGWGVGFAIALILLITTGGNFFDLGQLEDTGLINNNVLERLSQTEGAAPIEDDSTLARLAVVKLAWQMFANHPLLGNGIGSTRTLDVGGLSDHYISTHNQYLYFLTDHGILGILIYPLLIGAVLYPFKTQHRKINLAATVLFLIWGFCSHTMVLLRLHLIVFALLSTMNQNSRMLQASQPLSL